MRNIRIIIFESIYCAHCLCAQTIFLNPSGSAGCMMDLLRFHRVFRRWRSSDAPWAGWCDAGASMTALVAPEQPAQHGAPRDASTGAVAGLRPLHVVSRIGAALLGGYAFTWGLSVLGIAAGVAAGVPYDEATTRMMLPAFLVYLGAFLWAFAGKRLWLIWAVLLGCGAVMTGAAWLWQRALLS
jgi:hypothetical protein